MPHTCLRSIVPVSWSPVACYATRLRFDRRRRRRHSLEDIYERQIDNLTFNIHFVQSSHANKCKDKKKKNNNNKNFFVATEFGAQFLQFFFHGGHFLDDVGRDVGAADFYVFMVDATVLGAAIGLVDLRGGK